MKNHKFSKIKMFNGLKGFIFGFVLAVSLVAGAVYAWNAVWHGTDWIQAGRVVESEKIAENFEYLYQNTIKKDELQDCFGKYQKLEIKNKQFVCSDYTPKGCKIKYQVKTDSDTSDWVETDWGALNNGNWVYGQPAWVKGSSASIQYRIAIMCDDNSSLGLAYRFRGNNGSYNPWDKEVYSGTNTWNYGDWTTTETIKGVKSCSLKGGDGGCGMPMAYKDQSGSLKCYVQARYNKNTRYAQWRGPQDRLGENYGTSSAVTNCDTHDPKGCSFEMAVKCQ